MSFPSSPTVGQTAVVNGRQYVWSGAAWDLAASVDGHAATHAAAGADPVTPAAIGAAAATHTHSATDVTSGTLSDARLSANVVLTTDARLSNARTPASHAASHGTGGTDAISPESIGAATSANPTFTGVITVAAGAVGSPSITTTGDSNTGIYFPAADTVAIATAGAQRLRVDSAGGAGLGANPVAGRTLTVARNITGSTDGYGVLQQGVVQSGVTAACRGYGNVLSTAAATFTLPFYAHYSCDQGTIGANSVVTQQVGLYVGPSMTGAAANYGVRATIPAAAGRWNLFVDGSAQNWFAGNVGVGAGKSVPATALDVAGTVTSTGLDVAADAIRIRTARTPASATAAGNAGEIVWDANYVYVCVSSGNWKRASLAAW